MSLSQAIVKGGSRTIDPMSANIVLTVHDFVLQIFNPDNVRNVRLPDARLLPLGWTVYVIINLSGVNGLVVRTSDVAVLTTVAAGHAIKLGLTNNSTSVGTWVLQDSVVGVSPEPKPQLAFLFGGDGTSSNNDKTPQSYDYTTGVTTLRSQCTKVLVQGGAYNVSTIAYKAGPPTSDSAGRAHVKYVIDTYTFMAGLNNSDVLNVERAVLSLLDKGWLLGSATTTREWSLTDTWTSLVGSSATFVGTDNLAVNGYVSDEVNILAASSGASLNKHTLYNRTAETYVVAPQNPSANGTFHACGIREGGKYFGSVGGSHAFQTAVDNLHYAYDMSLGVLGSWITKLPFSLSSICQGAGGLHPTNANINIIMGGGGTASGTAQLTKFDVWFWNDVLTSWTLSPNSMPISKIQCTYSWCGLTQP